MQLSVALPAAVLLAAVTMCGAPGSAAADPEQGIAFKGGPNAATLGEDGRFNRYGLTGGMSGSLQWPLDGRFSFGGQLELLYSPRGARAIIDGEYLGRTRQHYLDLTVAARPTTRLGRVEVYLLAGGGLNVLLAASKEGLSGDTSDITDGLHRVDVALLVGVGAALHLSRREPTGFHLDTVFLEGRHDHGLLDTDATVGGSKNRASSLMVGVSFVLGTAARLPNT